MLDTQLEERFDQPSMHKVAEVERLLEDAAAGKAYAVPAAGKELYGRDVNVKRLEVQLKMLPDIMAQAASDASVALLTSEAEGRASSSSTSGNFSH